MKLISSHTSITTARNRSLTPKNGKKHTFARVTEMVEATYNAPSVVIWSLGNEGGPGNNFKAAYDHLKTIDKSRPVQYERNNDIVDMGSNQYPSVAWVEKAATGELNIKYPSTSRNMLTLWVMLSAISPIIGKQLIVANSSVVVLSGIG